MKFIIYIYHHAMRRLALLFFSCLFLAQSVNSQDFKVIGYLPYYRFHLSESIEFQKLTHLNIAFANPDMQGNLDIGGKDIAPIVEIAKEHDLVVMISLAGGGLTEEWADAWEHLLQTENRSTFIHKMMEYVAYHELDGIDVDLEWSHVNAKYSGFVLELRDSLSVHGKLMTAALPGTYRYPDITNAALAAYDWINMMVYDLTGSWAPSNPGPHSPYSFAETAISYWQEQGVPTEKLTLGVPFYGYDFSGSSVTAFTYSSFIEGNPDYAYLDQVGQAYYNGIPTIKLKTELAMQEVSGIMIWEIGQDDFGDLSLLNAIHETVGQFSSTSSEENVLLNAFPNPFDDQLILKNDSSQEFEISISDMSGRNLIFEKVFPYSILNVNTHRFLAGFFILSIRTDNYSVSKKLVKI
ncbi:MAG: T9SS type A sorting domain-containing protein [Bacteroidetes bacterium]|nr:T9SS type A sorting domain-containing protein [Bacteroidota bacterium]